MSADLGDGIVASATISNVTATGTYAQSVPFATERGTEIPFVESSDQFRTNIGLMSSGGGTVEVTLFDAAGNLIQSAIHVLAAAQLDQFTIAQRVTNGRIHLNVTAGDVAGYASVVDNVTGDASFVPAQ